MTELHRDATARMEMQSLRLLPGLRIPAAILNAAYATGASYRQGGDDVTDVLI